MYIDLDQKRNKNHFVHYWLLDNSKKVIRNTISLQSYVEFLVKIVNHKEKKERNWITDNIDALRSLKKIRFKIKKTLS